LHGRGGSEADSLGVPFVRDLALASGAIVAAPYARGDIQYGDPAPADIYATVDAVERAFSVDRGKVFLAGHSMGGFGVFAVAPVRADVWSALLCISGGLTNEDRNDVMHAFRGKTVYIVSGVKDDIVPHRYSQITVRWLRESNIKTRFYAEPEGGHSMATFRPALRAAWNDMLNGVRGDSGATNSPLEPLPPLPSGQVYKP
jgi:dienelactone hydrolase